MHSCLTFNLGARSNCALIWFGLLPPSSPSSPLHSAADTVWGCRLFREETGGHQGKVGDKKGGVSCHPHPHITPTLKAHCLRADETPHHANGSEGIFVIRPQTEQTRETDGLSAYKRVEVEASEPPHSGCRSPSGL